MKKSKNSMTGVIILSIAFFILFAASIALMGLYYYEAKESDAAKERVEALTEDISSLKTAIASLNDEISDLQDAAQDETTDAQIKDTFLTEEALSDELTESEQNTDETETLAEKNEAPVFEEKKEEEPLETQPDSDSSEEQNLTLTDKLFQALKNGAPNRLYETDEGSDEYYESYPHVIVYSYLDLTTGNKIEYNANRILYSASLIKAPYIYAVLREISEFEKSKTERDEEGNIVYLPDEEKYNLDEIWIYDSETMFVEGSGEIQEMPDGTEMTWRELFEYTILYSDNIAFAQIMDRFGRTSFNNLVAELGIKGTATGFMNLSAEDCVKFMTEIYNFFETGDQYALFMKENMMKSQHTVMICASFEQGTVPHKYGWDIDAYHDMAIIYDAYPYILVIMTDLDSGGEEVDNYIKSIVELTKQIHAENHST